MARYARLLLKFGRYSGIGYKIGHGYGSGQIYRKGEKKVTEYEAKLAIGSLLHDIGKVIFRWGDDHRNHSVSGI